MNDEFKPLPTQEVLLGAFRYDIETGKLYRVFKGGRLKETGHLTESGHLEVRFLTVRYYAHRLIWKILYGFDPPHIDHEDEDGTNNRAGNLRPANKSKNGMNRRAPRNNTSGFKGVTWHAKAGKWMAQITVSGQHHYLGIFSCQSEAHSAYSKACNNMHKEFANTGGKK